MAHTPGPWIVDSESGNDGEAEVIVAAERTICWTADTFDDEEGAVITDEDRANARLIASAPALLHALRLIAEDLNAMDSDTNGWREWDATSVDQVIAGALRRADLTIAKAEGRTDDQ